MQLYKNFLEDFYRKQADKDKREQYPLAAPDKDCDS